jgi:3-phenylpropionate/cinnamic acid dioxygenase small subunit
MNTVAEIDASLIGRVEQFYYREARLLDERCYQQWLGLLDPAIEYVMPARHVALRNPQLRGTEGFLAIDHELDREGPDESPLRYEVFAQLAARAIRAFQPNAWADNPPPRTRRLIANVEAENGEDGTIRAFSNFHLFYSHHTADNHHYVGCRRDTLVDTDTRLHLSRREVIIDWNVVTGPTLALLF